MPHIKQENGGGGSFTSQGWRCDVGTDASVGAAAVNAADARAGASVVLALVLVLVLVWVPLLRARLGHHALQPEMGFVPSAHAT